MNTDDKIKIIDLICQRHPSAGVEKGWSYYVGGMRDTGEWYFRKMLDADPQELIDFLNKLIAEENKPKIELTEEEKIKANTYIEIEVDGKKSWMTQLYKEQTEEFILRNANNFLFGSNKDA